MPGGNGNKFKGNKGKKGRRRKNPYADFDPDVDRYGKVIELMGGSHVRVQPIDCEEKDAVQARIPGKFYKKIWFKKDDFVVITQISNNLSELKGKVSESDINKVRGKFDKMSNGDSSNVIRFAGEDYSDSDEDNEDIEDSKKNSKKQIAPQRFIDTSIMNNTNADEEFCFDDI